MYSANLTSLLARPAREQPIGTLEGLEEAMRDRKYELVVERHSSSLTILEVKYIDYSIDDSKNTRKSLNESEPTVYNASISVWRRKNSLL